MVYEVLMNQRTPTIWALTDDRAGNTSQTLGVAEALGLVFQRKNIVYNDKVVKHNWWQGASLAGVDTTKSDSLKEPWPHVVIGAGRRLTPVLRAIKKLSPGTLTVQLMWPGWPTSGLDIVAVPEHDGKSPNNQRMVTIGAPHRITEEALAQESKIWQRTLGELPRPWIALAVGGKTKDTEMTLEHATLLGKAVNEMAKKEGGSVLLTTSRRTPRMFASEIVKTIGVPNYQHLWREDMKNVANPYVAYLAMADVVVVTGDSISMCTEACSSQKPVLIYAPEGSVPKKHTKLHTRLYGLDYAEAFDPKHIPSVKALVQDPHWKTNEPLNPAYVIAEEIMGHLDQ